MIRFRSIRLRNFLSYGNVDTEISLDNQEVTAIGGLNGMGKSVFIDAICFALFNKTFRNISKTTIINSVNNKNCLVSIAFSIGTKEYIVSRGIKPNVFEIYEDGVLLNQEAANKDYQKILEEHILQINYKTFVQIVIMGSATYKPFLELKAQERREFVEDLLDIKVFSEMRASLKERNDENNISLRDTEMQLTIKNEKAKTIESYIANVKKDRSTIKYGIESQIIELSNENSIFDPLIQEKISKRDALYSETTDLSVISERKNKITEFSKLYQYKIKEQSKEQSFFQSNSSCPTCSQEIDPELKEKKIESSSKKINDLLEADEKAKTKIGEYEEKYNIIASVLNETKKIDREITELSEKKNRNQWKIDSLNKELQKTIESINVENENIQLKELQNEISALQEKKDELNEKKYKFEICANMLKDNGIKASVIKNYIPVINTLINQYLAKLEFYVSFSLDETFNESIKARHRDTMSINNLSEGEKAKIDFAISFAFRTIAENKNTCNTNLLIIDEIFSSSMDAEGTEYIVKILEDMKQKSIFLISHTMKDIPERWNRKEARKIGNFSELNDIIA